MLLGGRDAASPLPVGRKARRNARREVSVISAGLPVRREQSLRAATIETIAAVSSHHPETREPQPDRRIQLLSLAAAKSHHRPSRLDRRTETGCSTFASG